MLRHIILWKLKDDIAEAEKPAVKERIKTSLEALPPFIDGLEELKVHTDAMASSSADLMLESLLRDEEALAYYRDHPKHVEAATYVRSVVDVRLCLDFNE